jgi:hypothetical protein
LEGHPALADEHHRRDSPTSPGAVGRTAHVGKDDLKKYEDWTAEFGQDGA